jgi:ribosome maturation factor RimP
MLLSMSEKTKRQVLDVIAQPLAAEGCEIADLALSQHKGDVMLRLFVYSSKGTSVGECGRLSRLIGDLIEGTDLFKSGYRLEVSSPGLDRPLTTALDFKYRVGETVRIQQPQGDRKKLTAEIVAATDTEVELRNDEGTFTIPISEIGQAKIVF